jgi:replicative DNA helicase
MNPSQDITLLQYQVLSTFVQQPHLFVRYAERLRVSYFAEGDFRQLINAMLQLHNNIGVFDKHLLRDYLIKQNAQTDLTWLDTLDYEMMELANLDEAVETLKNHALRTMFHELGINMLQKSFDTQVDVTDLKRMLQQRIHDVDELLPVNYTERLFDVVKRIQSTTVSTSGITWLDIQLQAYLGNLELGELVVIGGRPGMGKTAFLHTQMLHLAKQHNTPIGYINLIEKEEVLVSKLLKVSDEYQTNQPETNTLEQPWPIYFSNRILDNHIDEVCTAAKKLKYAFNIKVLAIDCFQQIIYTPKTSYRDYELGLILHRLKILARELDVVLLLTSQVSRAAERRGYNAIPMLCDLKDTSSLEEIADKVLFIYRYAYYGITEDEEGRRTEGESKIIIAKNTDGHTGEVNMLFDRENCKFTSMKAAPAFEFEFPVNRLSDLE